MKQSVAFLVLCLAIPFGWAAAGCASASSTASKAGHEPERPLANATGSLIVGSRVRLTTTPPETERGKGWYAVKGRIIEESETWVTLAAGSDEPYTMVKSDRRLLGGLFGIHDGRVTIVPDGHDAPVFIPASAVTNLEVAVSKNRWEHVPADAHLAVLPGSRLRLRTGLPHGSRRLGPHEIVYAGRFVAEDANVVTLERDGELVTQNKPGRSASGWFLSSDGESLLLRVDSSGVEARFLLNELEGLEVSVSGTSTLVPGVGVMMLSYPTGAALVLSGAISSFAPILAPLTLGAALASGEVERWVPISPDVFRQAPSAAGSRLAEE